MSGPTTTRGRPDRPPPTGQPPRDIEDAAALRRWCEDHDIHTVVVGGVDTLGRWRGQHLPVEVAAEGLEAGEAFSSVIFVLTPDETDLVARPDHLGPHGFFPAADGGLPDVWLVADVSTLRGLPSHPGTAAVTGSFRTADGAPVPVDPRHVLSRVVERLDRLGYRARVSLEYEFYLLEGPPTGRRRAAADLQPVSARSYLYDAYRAGRDHELLGELRQALVRAGIEVEAVHHENGPGQYELNVGHAEPLQAADDALFYKNVLKQAAGERGYTACFMAKPTSDWAGSSGHVHQSLWDPATGRNAFASEPGRLSTTAGRYLAGLLTTLPELTALLAPTPNAYTRFAPTLAFSPGTVTWGHDDRTAAVRVTGDTPSSRHFEHRVGGADANPYLAVAACLAGGVHGIEHELDLGPFPARREAEAAPERLPATLADAVDLLEASEVAREVLGDEFVDHFVALKHHEADRHREKVTDWEREQYLERA